MMMLLPFNELVCGKDKSKEASHLSASGQNQQNKKTKHGRNMHSKKKRKKKKWIESMKPICWMNIWSKQTWGLAVLRWCFAPNHLDKLTKMKKNEHKKRNLYCFNTWTQSVVSERRPILSWYPHKSSEWINVLIKAQTGVLRALTFSQNRHFLVTGHLHTKSVTKNIKRRSREQGCSVMGEWMSWGVHTGALKRDKSVLYSKKKKRKVLYGRKGVSMVASLNSRWGNIPAQSKKI